MHNTKEAENIAQPIEQDKSNSNESKNESGSRWQKGDEISLIRVRFPGNSRSFPFLQGTQSFRYGQKVVAMSDRGLDVGYVNSFPYKTAFKESMLPIRSINKIADDRDLATQKENYDREREAEVYCVEVATELKLDMTITHVETMQFGKKMVFYFNSPARVDFRDLVKKLVTKIKMRIELRQISIRDRAAALGSIGSCGLMTCCSSFLKNYGNVSIKMAKNQNLALIPSKLNGSCGQIKCCIKYEDEVYTKKRQVLPKEGSFVQTANGDRGKILKLHILAEEFNMITDRGKIRRYVAAQFDKHNNELPKDWKLPNDLGHITNEVSTVIGKKEVAIAADDYINQFNSEQSEQEDAPEQPEDAPEQPEDAPEEMEAQVKETTPEETEKPQRSKNRNRNRNRNRKRNQNREKTSSE